MFQRSDVGMENPCLTFVTPTLLAGDRSLVNVVAHEIAHSWTGNLVTNATWEHFWLNEGVWTCAQLSRHSLGYAELLSEVLLPLQSGRGAVLCFAGWARGDGFGEVGLPGRCRLTCAGLCCVKLCCAVLWNHLRLCVLCCSGCYVERLRIIIRLAETSCNRACSAAQCQALSCAWPQQCTHTLLPWRRYLLAPSLSRPELNAIFNVLRNGWDCIYAVGTHQALAILLEKRTRVGIYAEKAS